MCLPFPTSASIMPAGSNQILAVNYAILNVTANAILSMIKQTL